MAKGNTRLSRFWAAGTVLRAPECSLRGEVSEGGTMSDLSPSLALSTGSGTQGVPPKVWGMNDY